MTSLMKVLSDEFDPEKAVFELQLLITNVQALSARYGDEELNMQMAAQAFGIKPRFADFWELKKLYNVPVYQRKRDVFMLNVPAFVQWAFAEIKHLQHKPRHMPQEPVGEQGVLFTDNDRSKAQQAHPAQGKTL